MDVNGLWMAMVYCCLLLGLSLLDGEFSSTWMDGSSGSCWPSLGRARKRVFFEAMMGVSENGDTPKWPSNSRDNDEKPWELMDFGGFPWFFRQTQMNFPGSDWLRRQETLQAGHVHLILDGYRPSSWITKIAACFIAVIAGLPSHSFGSQKRV